MKTRKIIFFCKTITLCCCVSTYSANAFTSPLTPREQTIIMSSAASTAMNGVKRRKLSHGLKKVASFFVGTSSTKSTPFDLAVLEADNKMAESGRIVSFRMKNIGGATDSEGLIKIQLRPQWAPVAVSRFEELTENSFWDGCKIFRIIPGFVAQFGINGNPTTQRFWRSKSIPDDPVKVSNRRGTVVFATADGPNTRTTQIFINTRVEGNEFLDEQGFAPFGEVIEGMDLVDLFYDGYSSSDNVDAPNQGLIQSKGNAYLEEQFPALTYISKASFVEH